MGNSVARLFVLCIFAFTIAGQPPLVPPPPPENIPSGSLIIPMDNFHQGNDTQTTFNLRAYGLANLLLQNGVPVKWAIRPNKSKDDTDFTASFTRIAGTAGSAAGANASFSGGPFIVTQNLDNPAVRNLITTFNSGPEPDVTVYITTANALINIRYTLTHRPKIAIGPDGGGLGGEVHERVFTSAGIPNFESVSDDIINASACFTLATQAHSNTPEFVSVYKLFVQSGGNLLLQCQSIATYENNPAGLFQTTAGYTVFGTNDPFSAVDTTLLYPEGAMPFNQFIGILGNQDGAVTEYAYAPGSGPANGNRISVVNSPPHGEKFVATASELPGTSQEGRNVFELGGHDYERNGADLIQNINGRRMTLNTAFVPPTRPSSCGLTAGDASIDGQVRDANGRGISRAFITITNAATSESRTVITNQFGYYSIGGLQAGDVYQLNVRHKRYRFANPSVTLSLTDNVTGLAFVAAP